MLHFFYPLLFPHSLPYTNHFCQLSPDAVPQRGCERLREDGHHHWRSNWPGRSCSPEQDPVPEPAAEEWVTTKDMEITENDIDIPIAFYHSDLHVYIQYPNARTRNILVSGVSVKTAANHIIEVQGEKGRRKHSILL
jgi:hypothetical protein